MLAVKKITKAYLICLASLLACSWSSVATLSDPNVDDPFIAVNNNGEAMVVWTASVGEDLVIQASYFDGVYWYAYDTISDGGFNLNPTVKIDDNGNAIAVWEILDTDTLFRSIGTAARPTSSTWGVPEVVSVATTSTFTTLAVNESGQAIAGWVNQDNDTIEIVTQTLDSTWSAIDTITTGGGNKGNLQLGIDSTGNCIAVWEEFNNGTIVAKETTAGFESTWSGSTILSSSGQNTSPSLSVASSGEAIVSWIQNDDFNIYASLFQSGSWDASPTLLSAAFTYYPVSSALNGDFFVSWQNLETGQNQTLRYVSGSWDTAVDISDNNPNGVPVIAGIATTSTSGWTDLQTGELKVVTYATTGSPTSPEIISVSELNIDPELASSTTITAAAWIAYSELGETTIEANVD